jgi:hypothetical protein
MTAGLPSLFPACSLQGLVQLTRVARIERSSFAQQYARTRGRGAAVTFDWSSIHLARRVVVASSWVALVRLLRGQANRAGRLNAVLRATAACSSIRTHGIL